MDLMEESGLSTMIGKVNMDRNSPDYLREPSAKDSEEATREWLKMVADKLRPYKTDPYATVYTKLYR